MYCTSTNCNTTWHSSKIWASILKKISPKTMELSGFPEPENHPIFLNCLFSIPLKRALAMLMLTLAPKLFLIV